MRSFLSMKTHRERPAGMKIMIVTHAFPPMNATASHRVYSWAKTWSENGHEVHVVTPEKHAFDGSMDLNYDIGDLNIHTVSYLRRNKPGKASSDPFQKENIERWERLKTYTRKFRFGMGMFMDLRMLAFGPLMRKGRQLLRNGDFDFIISSYPPEVVHLAAERLSREFGIPWVADYRDLWFREMRLFQYRLTTYLSGIINRRLLRKAKVISTVSKGLSKRLEGLLNRQVAVSYNGFIRPQWEINSTRPWQDDKIHIVYTGRLYPKKRDPRTFLVAVATFRESEPSFDDRIAIDFYGYDVFYVESMAREFGLEKCVKAHGFVPYDESLRIQRNAGVLLFLDWAEEGAEGILTGKLFEYLTSNRPILCVGTRKDTEAAEIICRAKCGVVLTSGEEIYSYLHQLLGKEPEATRSIEQVAFYSRENQASMLLEAITQFIYSPA
jgi:glycosyltransferase involved in cell wall biosynthesis